MSLIADVLLLAASLGLAIYCVVLSQRLARFTDLEKGVGGAVAVLSAQVDDLTRVLKTARETAHGSAATLEETTARAEDVARRLELHIAAMHDLPSTPQPRPKAPEPPAPEPAPAEPPQAYDEEEADAAFAPALSFGARRGAVTRAANEAPTVFAHRRVQPGGLG